VGHGDRRQRLHRLQRLRRRLPGGEQHPVVGKDQVLRGREMHWLRVDTYYRGAAENPETYFQPVPCMQCENAPCEVVCPVGATVHSHEGLNDMVYNRCVGTRYCSDNCPYKVRRFNFLLYQDWNTPSLKLGRNPDVTGAQPRRDGEVHLLRAAASTRRRSIREGRPQVRDGEIKTACQQACPADAIVFGNLNDPASRVAQAAGRGPELLAARRAEHAAAHHVSGGGAQREPGAG
jgi:molybdopterin-containing oxidoreductase family iron-sulfur binding subunit